MNGPDCVLLHMAPTSGSISFEADLDADGGACRAGAFAGESACTCKVSYSPVPLITSAPRGGRSCAWLWSTRRAREPDVTLRGHQSWTKALEGRIALHVVVRHEHLCLEAVVEETGLTGVLDHLIRSSDSSPTTWKMPLRDSNVVSNCWSARSADPAAARARSAACCTSSEQHSEQGHAHMHPPAMPGNCCYHGMLCLEDCLAHVTPRLASREAGEQRAAFGHCEGISASPTSSRAWMGN